MVGRNASFLPGVNEMIPQRVVRDYERAAFAGTEENGARRALRAAPPRPPGQNAKQQAQQQRHTPSQADQ